MITNGVLVATTGHSSTPLTRRGSPGSAPAVNGVPSTSSVVPSTSSVGHTANTRDGVIGRNLRAAESQARCHFKSDAALSTFARAGSRILVKKSDTDEKKCKKEIR